MWWPIVMLLKVIGSDRLQSYLAAQNGDVTESIRLYTWNIEASCAVLGAYSALEVGVRNAMHRELGRMFDREDWWEAAPLRRNEVEQIREAEAYLQRRKGIDNWSAGHVVAELKASFWESLLVNRYHATLWEQGLKNAFPRYHGRRSDLRDRMERLRLLRNRAAHHEPIFARDLRVDDLYMSDLAGFIARELQEWVTSHSRLAAIIDHRASTVSGKRATRF
jgi:hypothetical protein